MASMVASRVNRSLVEYRHFEPSEHVDLIRFFREAGFPIAILPKDKGWGAWAGDRLVGCIALCHEAKTWILRGPEVMPPYQRRGVGAGLLHVALPTLQEHDCYCVAYPRLLRMYQRAGFRPCPLSDQPSFLRKRVAWLQETGWDLIILRRPSH
jgi:GNAT superfamily N-acetyltransferase